MAAAAATKKKVVKRGRGAAKRTAGAKVNKRGAKTAAGKRGGRKRTARSKSPAGRQPKRRMGRGSPKAKAKGEAEEVVAMTPEGVRPGRAASKAAAKKLVTKKRARRKTASPAKKVGRPAAVKSDEAATRSPKKMATTTAIESPKKKKVGRPRKREASASPKKQRAVSASPKKQEAAVVAPKKRGRPPKRKPNLPAKSLFRTRKAEEDSDELDASAPRRKLTKRILVETPKSPKKSPPKSPKKSPRKEEGDHKKSSPSPSLATKPRTGEERNPRGLCMGDVENVRQIIRESGEKVVIITAADHTRKERRPRVPWSVEEIGWLTKGYAEFGPSWHKIRTCGKYAFHESRTNVDLKDKFRNLRHAPLMCERPMRLFTVVDAQHNKVLHSETGREFSLRNRLPRDAALKLLYKDQFFPGGATEAVVHVMETGPQVREMGPAPPIVHVYLLQREEETALNERKQEWKAKVWGTGTSDLKVWKPLARKLRSERHIFAAELPQIEAHASRVLS